jgi:pimeloyl-ACP methyl ester carboxylesterase
MGHSAPPARQHEWLAYYERFGYFSAEAVRDGCHPRIMEHAEPTQKSIVLVHGLTDSPHFMTAIGDYFFSSLKYNVYLPLLHCHGLKAPNGMEGVDLEEWKANVDFAVDVAASRSNQVDVGGLSTGGTLALYAAANNPRVTGALYLFSAALDLAGRFGDIGGESRERLLRLTFLVDILDVFDDDEPLIGVHPYRYARMDVDGARELSRLIGETDALIDRFNPKDPLTKRVFAAHSEFDSTASISGIEKLQSISSPDQFTFFRIPKAAGVNHASLVLKDPIYATGASDVDNPLENANPRFQDMMAAIASMK